MALNALQKQEVDSLSETFPTRRPVVESLEEKLYTPQKVLDHGFVRIIDYMGDDTAIVQAARVSYGKGTKQTSQDRGLIRYLMRHRHSTPFEMCEIKFHIKLPIFIARQWIRHRTANVNEYSARYSILSKEFYMPEPAQLGTQSKSNNQGRANVLQGAEAARVFELLKEDAERCYSHYEEMLNETADGNVIDENRQGLARELARMNLTMNMYTEWYWKIDLHNLFHFLSLRADSHAQYEIRAYADVMLEMVKEWVPYAYEAFEEYRLHGAHLSRTGIEIVSRALKGEKITQENSGLTPREWRELAALLPLEN